jgi:hypothetical protein
MLLGQVRKEAAGVRRSVLALPSFPFSHVYEIIFR